MALWFSEPLEAALRSCSFSHTDVGNVCVFAADDFPHFPAHILGFMYAPRFVVAVACGY